MSKQTDACRKRRALQKRLYSAKETYNLKVPTNRSHRIICTCDMYMYMWDDTKICLEYVEGDRCMPQMCQMRQTYAFNTMNVSNKTVSFEAYIYLIWHILMHMSISFGIFEAYICIIWHSLIWRMIYTHIYSRFSARQSSCCVLCVGLLRTTGLFCKRALQKILYSAKCALCWLLSTYIGPTNRVWYDIHLSYVTHYLYLRCDRAVVVCSIRRSLWTYVDLSRNFCCDTHLSFYEINLFFYKSVLRRDRAVVVCWAMRDVHQKRVEKKSWKRPTYVDRDLYVWVEHGSGMLGD